jgi:hypothetical protein
VDGYGQRLGESADLEVNRRRELVQGVRRHVDVLGETAVDRIACDLELWTKLVVPGATVRTAAAYHERLDRDAIAFLYSVNARAHGDDFAGDLMSRANRRRGKHAVVEVKVAAANATVLHP